MMSNIARSTNIFISTRNVTNTDTINNFTIDMNDDCLKLDNPNNQKFRISLIDFAMPYLYDEINNNNNTIDINGTSISLPPGIYKYNEITSYINGVMGSTVINFDVNQIKFVFGGNVIVEFPNIWSAKVWGFNGLGPYSSVTGITSDRMLNEMLLKKIYICIEDLPESSRGRNYDNLTSGEFKISNILMPIPIRVQPGELIYHNDVRYAEKHLMEFNMEQIRNLTLTLRDSYGNLLQNLPDWEGTINVEVVDIIDLTTKAMLLELEKIGRDIKMDNLRKYMNYINAPDRTRQTYYPPKITVKT